MPKKIDIRIKVYEKIFGPLMGYSVEELRTMAEDIEANASDMIELDLAKVVARCANLLAFAEFAVGERELEDD